MRVNFKTWGEPKQTTSTLVNVDTERHSLSVVRLVFSMLPRLNILCTNLLKLYYTKITINLCHCVQFMYTYPHKNSEEKWNILIHGMPFDIICKVINLLNWFSFWSTVYKLPASISATKDMKSSHAAQQLTMLL